MNNTIKTFIKEILFFCLIIFTCYFVTQHIAQRVVVEGASMNPTFTDGSDLIMSRISYIEDDPQRGDIIVFPYQYEDNTYFIKRIIGLPGETVQIVDGTIYINGEVLGESYGREVMKNSGMAADPITLGDDEYFVLGDNRNDSTDSRDPSVGKIKRNQIIGRAWVRIWPLSKIGILRHQ